MNLDDVFRLSRLRGWDMVDQTAVVVAGGAKGTPSTIARPLQSLLPDALQPLHGKWKEAADRVDDHIGALNGQVTVIRANWDTPDSFLPYMNNMTAVLGKQQKAMQDMDGAVTQLAATLKQYKQDAADSNETLHEAFWNALIWGCAALVVAIAAEYAAAAFTAGATAWSTAAVIETIVAAVAGAIAGFLGSWMPYQHNTQKLLRNELDGLTGELSTVQAEADSQHVKDITPTAAPAITWRGYRSIHDPDF